MWAWRDGGRACTPQATAPAPTQGEALSSPASEGHCAWLGCPCWVASGSVSGGRSKWLGPAVPLPDSAAAAPTTMTPSHSSSLQVRSPPCPLVVLRESSPEPHPVTLPPPILQGLPILGPLKSATCWLCGLRLVSLFSSGKRDRTSIEGFVVLSASYPHFLLVLPLRHCPFISRTDKWRDGAGRCCTGSQDTWAVPTPP